MNIYDFDDTIYDGDSSIDFFKYCSKKNKKGLLILPKMFIFTILYKIKIINKEKLKSVFFSFLIYINDIDKMVINFWKINNKKIKTFYLNKKDKTDIIISASPEFLLLPISKELGFNLIATIVNKKTGKLEGKNCHGEEKVKRLKLEKKVTKCNEFYSDSLSDMPLANIAKKAFIVKKNNIIEWKN